MNTIKCERISKSFYLNNQEKKVFEDINKTFYQNKSYAIMGPSGSGKSTFLSLISLIDYPTTGAIYFNEKNILDFSKSEKESFLKNSVGLIFQEPNLIQEFTVLENITLKSGLDNKNDLERAYYILESIGLSPDVANFSPEILSGGEQQRVAIARAVFLKPAFLIADEPTAHLDEANKHLALELLKKFKNENMGIILATHDQEVANSMEELFLLN